MLPVKFDAVLLCFRLLMREEYNISSLLTAKKRLYKLSGLLSKMQKIERFFGIAL